MTDLICQLNHVTPSLKTPVASLALGIELDFTASKGLHRLTSSILSSLTNAASLWLLASSHVQ